MQTPRDNNVTIVRKREFQSSSANSISQGSFAASASSLMRKKIEGGKKEGAGWREII